ncbi:MAG: hypothetical protein ACYTEX_02320 [Planctomycetota bacterium]|jgi:hypothetical protein
MEKVKILTIVVLALALMVASGRVSGTEPMGTAFTYQGRLIEAGSPAEGQYDFRFALYDEPVDGNQLNGTIEANEVPVSNGYFTVVLDFGAGVFDGDAHWLDIAVRHGALTDPNSYAPLDPRQEVTPAPHALYAQNAGAALGGITGAGTANYIAKFTGPNTIGDSAIREWSSEVGINGRNLVLDNMRSYMCENSASAMVGLLFMDGNDDVHLGDYSGSGDLRLRANGDRVVIDGNSGNVGIGTTDPGTKLDVQGGDINTSGKIKEGGNNLIPSGAVMFFNLPSCPSGWSELTAARGRYVVGKPSGGTLAGTQGTALIDLENRAVGQHNHSITDPGHSHELASHGNMNCGSGCSHLWVYAGGYYTQSSTTGITIDNEGSVAGTNAPYIQLCACQKD